MSAPRISAIGSGPGERGSVSSVRRRNAGCVRTGRVSALFEFRPHRSANLSAGIDATHARPRCDPSDHRCRLLVGSAKPRLVSAALETIRAPVELTRKVDSGARRSQGKGEQKEKASRAQSRLAFFVFEKPDRKS